LFQAFRWDSITLTRSTKSKEVCLRKAGNKCELESRKKEEAMPEVIKLSIREKKGAEHLTTHPHDFFLG
jgi:hypothetical protein